MQHVLLISIVLSLLSGAAWAKESGGQLIGRSLECVIPGDAADFNIPVNPDVITALYFPSNLVGGMRPKSWSRDFKIVTERNALYIRPHSDRRDATASLVVRTDEPTLRVSLFLQRVESANDAMRSCKFVEQSALEVENARIEAAVNARENIILARLEQEEQKRKRAQHVDTVRQRLIIESEWVSVVRQVSGDSSVMDIEIGRGTWIDGEFWAAFSVHNRHWQPLRLAHAQIRDRSGSVIPMHDVFVDAPATPQNGAIAEIPPSQRASGIMRLPGVADAIEPQAIMFRGLTGPRMVVATAEEPVWIFVPKRKEEIDAEKREEAAQGWWSLHALASFGAAWLSNPQDAGDLEVTTLLGFGLRTTYSLMSFLLFEGEALYASTGEARFDSGLLRSARLGRLHLGLLLRLGSGGIVPVVRGGVGMQGAFYNAEIDGMEAHGDGFELNALWYFGPGLVVPMGNRCVLGLGASYMAGVKTNEQSFGMSMDLGCAWKP